jgi:hypothetical protein
LRSWSSSGSPLAAGCAATGELATGVLATGAVGGVEPGTGPAGGGLQLPDTGTLAGVPS